MAYTATVDQDKSWEAQAVPLLLEAIQSAFGGTFRQATPDEDLNSGTDAHWHRQGQSARVAVRARRPEFLKYRHDFTIREDRPQTGNATELQKIRGGRWAGLYLYGFCTDTAVLAWSLFRMKHFDENAPFHYMPGFGPGDGKDTVTRLYSALSQPPGFLITCRTSHPFKGLQGTSEKHATKERTAA